MHYHPPSKNIGGDESPHSLRDVRSFLTSSNVVRSRTLHQRTKDIAPDVFDTNMHVVDL